MPDTAPHLLFAALGGTIASTSNNLGGVAPALSGAEIAAAAGLEDIWPDLHAEFAQVAQVSSANVTLDILHDVVELARTSRASGLVLTQGTDTLEESAFGLWLLNDSGLPIAATGAMRNPTLPGADGPANVRAAAMAVLSPALRHLPCTLVFNDEVHDPRFVRKTHITSTAAFSSGPVLGAIGWISERTVLAPHAPRPWSSPFAGLRRPAAFAPIALVEVGMGEGPQALQAIVETDFAGAVISGVGGGHIPEHLITEVEELAQTVPLVLASRPGSGASLRDTYSYPGGEIGLLTAGLIPAGILDARKARMLLSLSLSYGLDPAEVFAAVA
ncbi:L-asparaginase [Brevibacterium sanguinis]|uniref:L-asparaginase n=2 Tax=Brevibacterium TaxID=1696 RepID=A0A366IGX7_9MICO|nr:MULTISPECIES: asparaginase domain-containing protein [Brevibacterium]RBP62564.1 L-asparaginase [Brevibacterium sanguinis]RBP69228.1 L-asparaginase [Brevibacterium celere]